jgi:L-threonylcarbamoyladenylate synthase
LSSTLRRFLAADGVLPRRVRTEIGTLLAEGGIVALPTETVYGLAVRADRSNAVRRLREVKGREPKLPLTWHVASLAPLEIVEELPRTVHRLASRYWPGPLTLVVRADTEDTREVSDAGWLGMRLPAHAGTRSLLAELPFPVVMSSANKSGAPPLCDADGVAKEFGATIDYLVDGGPTRMREPSAVLRVGRGKFELLREGLLSIDELRHTAGLRIGFVCTGNTCRSPMARTLAHGLIAERLGTRAIEDFGFEVTSMGLSASYGSPASPEAVSVMTARGLDLSDHSSRMATLELLSELDHVYGLTEAHVDALRAMLPPKRMGIVELLDPDGCDVPDPIGGPLEDYERSAALISAAIEHRANEWI